MLRVSKNTPTRGGTHHLCLTKPAATTTTTRTTTTTTLYESRKTGEQEEIGRSANAPTPPNHHQISLLKNLGRFSNSGDSGRSQEQEETRRNSDPRRAIPPQQQEVVLVANKQKKKDDDHHPAANGEQGSFSCSSPVSSSFSSPFLVLSSEQKKDDEQQQPAAPTQHDKGDETEELPSEMNDTSFEAPPSLHIPAAFMGNPRSIPKKQKEDAAPLKKEETEQEAEQGTRTPLRPGNRRRGGNFLASSRPGAVRVGGGMNDDEGGTIVVGSSEMSAIAANYPHLQGALPAFIVPEGPQEEFKMAATSSQRRNNIWIAPGCGIVLVIGGISAIVLAALYFGQSSSSSSSPPEEDKNSTTVWVPQGGDAVVTGVSSFDRLGWDVSVSRDGSTISVAAIQYIQELFPNISSGTMGPGYFRTFGVDEVDACPNEKGQQLLGTNHWYFYSSATALSQTGDVLAASHGNVVSVYRLKKTANRRLLGGGGTAKNEWQPMGPPMSNAAYDVSLSGDGTILAFSSIDPDSSLYGNPFSLGLGVVRVLHYDEGSNTWLPYGQILHGANIGDVFGLAVSLSLSGNRLVVGIPGADARGSITGSVQVFDFNGTWWNPIGGEEPMDGYGDGDGYGLAATISDRGDCIAAGAPQRDSALNSLNPPEGSRPGYVLVHCLDEEGRWKRRGGILNGRRSAEAFGFSVDLSADGRTVVVGAPDVKVGDNFAGRVTIHRYKEDTEDWTTVGEFYGELPNERLGIAVSMADHVVAAGGPYADLDDSDAGVPLESAGVARFYHEIEEGNEPNVERCPPL